MENQKNGFGVVIIPAEEGRRLWFFEGSVPKAILAKYAKGAQFIFFLEAVAQYLPFWIYWSWLKGPYLSYIDNSSAQWALTKGYSNNEQANVLVTLFWSAVTERQGDPWFERVPTKANISDSVSRGDKGTAKQRGWAEVEVDLREVWNLLDEAVGAGYDKLPEIAKRLCLAAKVKNVP